MSNQEFPAASADARYVKSTALGSLALAAGGDIFAVYAARARGGGTTGYRRQHPHCLGRLLG